MCLSPKTVEVCKLSAPVIVKHSESVASKLYAILYEKSPRAKELFGGTSKAQYKQFKRAITLYYKNIDKIKTWDCSVPHIDSEYNSMIKKSLLQAIKDVFGDAATNDIIEAWKESYVFLEDIVITREKELYASA
jgi:nitric oxide dioxygenase